MCANYEKLFTVLDARTVGYIETNGTLTIPAQPGNRGTGWAVMRKPCRPNTTYQGLRFKW